MIRQISTSSSLKNVKERVELILKNIKLLGSLRDKFLVAPLKDQSNSVLKLWARQCECVLAQRLRRGQQMFCLYSKLWEERALRDFIRQMRHRIGIKGRDFLIGAVGLSVYDWKSNRIPESEIRKHANELAYIKKLKDQTLCSKCSKDSTICPCQKNTPQGEKPILKSFDDWNVFIEKKDLVVWRRAHKSGNFEYKVYGSYPDVSAEDFLNVQIDINYRKTWDNTAITLNVVEKDPEPTSNSDIVYWEMLWPTLFANRDYVFNRRYLVDHKAKTLFLVSKSTKHPVCPKEPTKFRIEDYWSYMVIKPYSELNKPGIEFSLTYFDNPGVNIPASVTTWVAMKAMPDFLERLRDASRKYKKYCHDSGLCQICNIMDTQYLNRNELYWDYFDDDIIDNTIYEARFKIKPPVEKENDEVELTSSKTAAEEGVDEMASPPQTANQQTEKHNSFWR